MAASLLMINHARVSASHQTVRSVADLLKIVRHQGHDQQLHSRCLTSGLLALSVIEQTQHDTDDFTDVVVATAFLTGYRQTFP